MKHICLPPLLLVLVIACGRVVQFTPSMASPNSASTASTTPTFPKPRVNIFAGMTSNQEACLRQAWGNEVFQAITTYQRPTHRDEEKAIPQCMGDMVPGKTPLPTKAVSKPPNLLSHRSPTTSHSHRAMLIIHSDLRNQDPGACS